MLYLTTIILYCILASNAISPEDRQPVLTKRSLTEKHSHRRTLLNNVLPPIHEDEEFSETGSDDSSLADLKTGSASPMDTFQDPNGQIKELVSQMRDGAEKYDIQNLLMTTALTMPAPFNKEELLIRALCQGPLGVSRYAMPMREKLSSLLVQDIASICSLLDVINIPAFSSKNWKTQPSLTAHKKDDLDDKYYSFTSDGFDKLKTSETVRPEHSSGSLLLDNNSIQRSLEQIKADPGKDSLNFKWRNPYLASEKYYFNNAENSVTPNHKLYYSKGDKKSNTDFDFSNLPFLPKSSVEEDELETSVHHGTPPSAYGRKRSDAITDFDQPNLPFLPKSSVEEDDLDQSIHGGSSRRPHHTSADMEVKKSPLILPKVRKSELTNILPAETVARVKDLIASKNHLQSQKVKFEPPKWIGN